jgi:hypothetical protein
VSLLNWWPLSLWQRKKKRIAAAEEAETVPLELVAAANVFETLAVDTDLKLVDVMYRNAIWGREEVTAMLEIYRQHLMNGDHDDPMECDVWCLPAPVSDRLDRLNENQIVILFLVLFKAYFAAAATLQQQRDDS